MFTSILNKVKLALVSSFALALVACSPTPPEFHGSDITGTGLGKELSMPDTEGNLRSIKDFKGKVVVAFFGFTQCPDVCPTALAELSHTLDLLDDQASNVQVLFMTVDPDRDTPEIVQEYVQTFNPSFIGLVGNSKQLETAANSFKAYYSKVQSDTSGYYTMDHTASFYVFDKKGNVRVLIGGDAPAEEIAEDIKQLL